MTSRGKGAHLVKRAQTCLPPPTSCNSVTPSSHRAPIPPSYIFMRFHAQQADESSSCCQSSCILPLKHAIQAINLRENKIRRRRHPIQPKYETYDAVCTEKQVKNPWSSFITCNSIDDIYRVVFWGLVIPHCCIQTLSRMTSGKAFGSISNHHGTFLINLEARLRDRH